MTTFHNNTTKDDYDNSNKETIPYADAEPIEEYGEIPNQQLVCHGPQTFIIKHDWFGAPRNAGNAQITTTEPNSNEESPCFKMSRTGGTCLLYNSTLVITDMSNRPLLSLKEYWSKFGVGMEVCHTNGLPLCRIYRQGFHLTIKNRYKIELLDEFSALQHHQYPAGITCIGHSRLPYRFELTDTESGQELATIKKNFQITGGVYGGSKWQLDLPSGLDAESAILFLGITCALDSVHTEHTKRQGYAAAAASSC